MKTLNGQQLMVKGQCSTRHNNLRCLLLLLISYCLTLVASHAQFTYAVVQDKPVNGQLKRMVYIDWDDWQPTTKTFLGIPRNAKGFAFWRVLNNKYYTGQDSRPYRADGPFIKNHADLTLQERSDMKITDSTEKIRDTHAATYLNMSGGQADAAYNLFFKKKFDDIFNSFNEWETGMRSEYPKAYEASTQSSYFTKFKEYLEITKDRIQANHEAFVDKGVRLEAYINLYKELLEKYQVVSKYLAGQVLLSKLPTQKELRETKSLPVFNKDKEIVKHILGNYKF